MNILIVDDDEHIRDYLCQILKSWHYGVMDCEDGEQAWTYLQAHPVDMVISDWMMPGMSGPDLCRCIRGANSPYYIYIILLTARATPEDLVFGMQAGADDFVSKPFHPKELEVRIRAGRRIIDLEHNLRDRNAKLRKTYDRMRFDLDAAADLQRDLLPPAKEIGHISFDWAFRPSSTVGGDFFNFFEISERQVVFYIMDVSGHGVSAAMYAFTFNHVLFSYFKDQRTYTLNDDEMSPDMILKDINHHFHVTGDVLRYCTLVLGVIDTVSGEVRLVQAGHPPPILFMRSKRMRVMETGGLPVGMLPKASYKVQQLTLNPGDRLILYSDGVTECNNPDREELGMDRFKKVIKRHTTGPGAAILDELMAELKIWRHDINFNDDVTMLLIERKAY